MRFVTIVGARPQFIKAAPLSAELRRRHEEFLVHTGQHYDDNMSDVFFREMGIPAPDKHLEVGSGSHGTQTGAMLERIEAVLDEQHPDAVIVYGDTNSTLAGALAAAKLQIPIAHVEAGLRSFNRTMPEEINRVVTDHLAAWLLVPSDVAAGHLAAEGITKGVWGVGDIMADSVRRFSPLAGQRSDILQRVGVEAGNYVLATVHRAENTDDPQRLAGILAGLRQVPYPVVLPLHPRTRAAIVRHGILFHFDGAPSGSQDAVIAVEPLGYLDMLQLQQQAAMILTDSGGVQKEAYYLGVPCVTLRDETEWTETVEVGWNSLVGADPKCLLDAVQRFRNGGPVQRPSLYGDGHTAERILEVLSAVS